MRIQLVLALAWLLGGSGCFSGKPETSTPERDAAQSRSQRQQLSDGTVVILEQADQFELLALDPLFTRAESSFHGYKILGAAKITKADTRRRLISALLQSIRESDGTVAQCFNPRHGIRATRNGKQADLVILFECLSFRLYGDSEGGFVITDRPKALFDEVLKKTALRLWIPRPSWHDTVLLKNSLPVLFSPPTGSQPKTRTDYSQKILRKLFQRNS